MGWQQWFASCRWPRTWHKSEQVPELMDPDAMLHRPGNRSPCYHLASSEDKQSQGSELYLGAGPHVGECLQFGRTAWAQAFGMVCGVDKRGNHEGD